MNLALPAFVRRLILPRARTTGRRRAALTTSAATLALCGALAAALAGCGAGADALAVESVNGNAVSMTTYQQIVAIYKDQSASGGQSADWQSPSGRALLSQMQAGALDFLANALLYHEQVAQQHLSVTTKDVQAQLTSLGNSIKSAAQQSPNDAEIRGLAQAIKAATAEVSHHADLNTLIAGRASPADVLVIYAYYFADAQVLSTHAKVPTAKVRLIEVNTKQLAEALRTQAQHGTDFGALAKAHSLDSATGQQGGDLGRPYFYVGQLSQLSPALDKAIFGPPVSSAKTSYVIVPLDSTKNSKYLLAEVTKRATTSLAALNDSTTQSSIRSGWLALVVKPSATIQQYVAVDPTPTPTTAPTTGG